MNQKKTIKRHISRPMFTICRLLIWYGIMLLFYTGDLMADASEKKMVLVYIVPKESMLGGWVNSIYTEAFKRIGIEFVYEQYPGRRCSVMADEGSVDGEVARIASYANSHPNLIRVRESGFDVNFIAFSADPDINIDGWKSLRDKDYKIVGKRGVKKLQEKLPGVVKKENTYFVSKWSYGFKMLADRRADVFIDVDVGAGRLLDSDEFKSSGIRIAGLMEKEATYAYLHRKHKSVVPQLEKALREMKKEGLIKHFRKLAEAKYKNK